MEQFQYKSDMNGGSLMVRESRVIADLLLSGVTSNQWDDAIKVENVLQKRSTASAIRNGNAIRQRLERLGPDFWMALRDGDDELSTQVAFCGVLERNLLLVEFLETVLKDAYRSRFEKLEAYTWGDFLDDRSIRDPSIGDWKESTRKKTGQIAFRMLSDVGFLKSTRSRELQNVVIRRELKVLLEKHNKQRIDQCMEVSSRTQ